MNRKIYAEISADESQITRFCETNGLKDDGLIDTFEREFGWVEDSGFYLQRSLISDYDSTDEWERYIDYVISWGFENYGAEDHPTIKTYRKWRDGNQ